MKSGIRFGLTMVGLSAILIAAGAVTATAAALQRLSSEFQSGGEISTSATPIAAPDPAAPGGVVVYDKTISLPQDVTYITFSAQGDTHIGTDPDTGITDSAGLLMSASIVDSAGTETVCQPMASASGAAEVQAP